LAGSELLVVLFKKQNPAWVYPGESDKGHSPGRKKVHAHKLLTPLNPLSWHRTVRAVLALQPNHVIFHWWVTSWVSMLRILNKAGGNL